MPLDTRENIELALLNTPNYELPEYKFVHDRIQQAAYALILEPEKPETHLKIGKQLLEKLSEQQREKKIFEIVNNLNLGRELITTQSEKDALAKLNLLAGQKAKIATAYNATVEYLNVGIKLLSTDSWQSQYHLTLSLYSEAVEAAYLNGNYEEMEKLAEVAIEQAKTLLVEKIDPIDLGFPIGLVSEIADFIDQTTVKLNSEDVVILYSDGITEAENINKQLYGLEKLCQIVRENRALSAQEIRQAVIEDLRQFIGNQKVFDDITLVILKQK